METQEFNKRSTRNDVKDLDKRKIFTVKTGREGKEITCLGGTIWITQTGDGIDRILTSGDSYLSRIPGDILIEGLDHSRIRISPLQKVEVIRDLQNRTQIQPA